MSHPVTHLTPCLQETGKPQSLAMPMRSPPHPTPPHLVRKMGEIHAGGGRPGLAVGGLTK